MQRKKDLAQKMRASLSIPLLDALLLTCLFSVISTAHAFNGYFYSGQGIKAKGMSGAVTAVVGDAFAGGNNPASSMFSGDRFEIGADQVITKQTSDRFGGTPQDVRTSGRRTDNRMPEFGINRVISADVSLGLSFYRNGLIRSAYENNEFFNIIASPLAKQSDILRFSLEQDVLAPVVAFRIGEESSVGIAPLLVSQRLKVTGLHLFKNEPDWSIARDNVTNVGVENSFGVGVRIGFMSRLHERLMFGATYSPEISMSSFNKYRGLFADNAEFDVPMNYSVGFAFAANPLTVISVDYQHIDYGSVRLLNNASNLYKIPGLEFGSQNGAGYGWQNVRVWKFGIEWRWRDDLTLRTGFSFNNSPIRADDVSMAVLMPSITTQEQSVGGTYSFDRHNAVSFYYALSKGPEINGLSAINAGGGRETLKVRNQSFGLQYSYQY